MATPVGTDRDVRAPLQERSRQSFERVQDAALSLLRERGDDGFTLAEVSARSGVSTGSIYGRVSGKDALIRLVHAREMERIDLEAVSALRAAAATATDLEAAVRALVGTLDAFLGREAPVLRPFMLRAAHDPEVSALGHRTGQSEQAAFCDGLLLHRREIARRDPAAAAAWCHTVVYAVLARHYGLSTTTEAKDDIDLGVTLDNLASMVRAFLTTADAPRRARRTRKA